MAIVPSMKDVGQMKAQSGVPVTVANSCTNMNADGSINASGEDAVGDIDSIAVAVRVTRKD